MYLPIWLLVALVVLLGAAILWLGLILAGRNPLPVPDGDRAFSPLQIPPPGLLSSISSRSMVFASDSK